MTQTNQMDRYLRGELTAVENMDLNKDVEKFVKNIKDRWGKEMNKARFLDSASNMKFLEKDIAFKYRVPKKVKANPPANPPIPPIGGRRRARKPRVPTMRKAYKKFDELNERSQRRESAKIRQTFRRGAIIKAAKWHLGKRGGNVRYAETLIDKMAKDPDFAEKLNKKLKRLKEKQPIEIKPSRMLVDMSDRDFSNGDATTIKKTMKKHNADIVPCKERIKEEKDRCYPANIEVGDWEVRVPFNEVRRKTLERLLEIPEYQEMVIRLREYYEGEVEFEDLWKYGSDGLGELPICKLRSDGKCDLNGDTNHFCEDHIFFSQCVLMQIKAKARNGKPEKVVWVNPFINCFKGCRPLRICFEKENEFTTKREFERMKAEIDEMEEFCPEDNVRFTFKGLSTLYDQLAMSRLVDEKASSRCPLCGAGPNEMCNKDGCFTIRDHQNMLKMGIQNLHFGPRSMEMVINIGENIEFKKYQPETDEEIKKKKDKKVYIEKTLAKDLNIHVNKVLPGSKTGNSNTGGTAREFYRNAEQVAQILNVPERLVTGLRTMWEIIRCPYPVDSDKAQAFCDEFMQWYFTEFANSEETHRKRRQKKLVRLDCWPKIKPTVHKIALHLKDILDNIEVPPGFVDESPSECNNQHVRLILEKLTRKDSREHMMTDLVHRLLIQSDPIILGHQAEEALKKRKRMPLSAEVKAMIKCPLNVVDPEQHFYDDNAMEITDEDLDQYENEEALESLELNPDNNDDRMFEDVLEDELILPQPSTSSGLGRPKRNVQRPVRFRKSSSESSEEEVNFVGGHGDLSFDWGGEKDDAHPRKKQRKN